MTSYNIVASTDDVWFDECVSYTDPGVIKNKKYFEGGDILFAITGERVEDIGKSCAYIGNDICLAGGDMVVMKHNENPKYLAYALSTNEARYQKSRGKVKSKVVHTNIPSLKDIKIPVPSIEEQERIVNILDKFHILTSYITKGLPAEIEARRKQYEYYRNKLLTFEESES